MPIDKAQDEARIFVGDEAMAVGLKAEFENLIVLKGGKKDPFRVAVRLLVAKAHSNIVGDADSARPSYPESNQMQ